jgi:crossover junction endodeoxyribonuclease RusA
MKPIILLTTPPPTANNLFRNVPGKGRVKTDRYKAWLAEPLFLATPDMGFRRLATPPAAPLTMDVRISIECPRERKNSDLDNRIKGLIDRITKGGWLADDKQVVEIHARWADLPACRVTIAEAA